MSGFNALNAKIGVLRKGLFNSADYEKILSFEKREDIINYIKENPIYKDEMTKMYQDVMNYRYAAEFMVKKTEVDIFRKLEHFLFGEDKKIFSAMLVRYEFEDIKLILRSIVEKENLDLEKDTLLYKMENHVDYDRLYRCETIGQALDLLKNTAFKRAFFGLADEDVLKLHFHVEMNLDILYFAMVKKVYVKLKPGDKKIIEDYYTSLVDAINIQWIIRAKKYYNLSNEEIFNYCIRFGKYVKGEFLKELVYSAGVDDVIQKISGTKLSKYFSGEVSTAYRDMQAKAYVRQLNHLKSYQDTISTFLKFIIQLLIQNENLVRISESRKYELPKEEIKKYLINT